MPCWSVHAQISSRLHFLFPQSLLQSLDLVDHKRITRLVTPSGRQLYQVVQHTVTCVPQLCISHLLALVVLLNADICDNPLQIYLV